VRNVRVAGGEVELESGGGAEPIRVTELPVEERAPVLAAYRSKVGKAVASHFEAPPDPAHTRRSASNHRDRPARPGSGGSTP
jgi:hypothetical protein